MKCAMCSAEHKGEERVLERQREFLDDLLYKRWRPLVMSEVILPAAASSTNQVRVPVEGLTRRAGRSSWEAGSKIFWRMSCLPAPAATNAT